MLTDHRLCNYEYQVWINGIWMLSSDQWVCFKQHDHIIYLCITEWRSALLWGILLSSQDVPQFRNQGIYVLPTSVHAPNVTVRWSIRSLHVYLLFQLFHRLKAGEVLTINNRRILHSRRGFKLNGGARHLQVGCMATKHYTLGIHSARSDVNWR